MITSPPRRRVLHLVGSEVSEFFCDLSRLYADDCLHATADPERYETVIAYVSPGGGWRFPSDLSEVSLHAAELVPLSRAVQVISDLRPDAVVPQMFCLPGMTTYRALFDLLGVPYPGNAPETMALAAHKARAKAVVAAAGVRVPEGRLVVSGEEPPLPLPVVVKPVDADNSHGVSLVRRREEYDAAVQGALEHSAHALVEEYVELGREVRCGVLEVDDELVCLPLEEYAVDRDTAPVRSEADKLRRSEDGSLGLVAKTAAHAWILDPDDPVTARVWEAARRCHRSLGCRDYGLFDFRVDADGEPWFLEAGLYSSFAEKSVISTMARAAGIPLPELFSTVLERAVARRTPTVWSTR